MYRCRIEGAGQQLHQYEELIKVFLPKEQYQLTGESAASRETAESGGPSAAGGGICRDNMAAGGSGLDGISCKVFRFQGDKDELKRALYRDLQRETGKSPKWGILTGIRPVKLAGELYDGLIAGQAAKMQGAGACDPKTYDEKRMHGANACDAEMLKKVQKTLERDYLLHPAKSALVTEILDYQRHLLGRPKPESISIYLGIPFCPTRCLYCAFTSNQVARPEIDRYLEALYKELSYCAGLVKAGGRIPESLYIGGGTPTTLDENQLAALLQKIADSFELASLAEYTVEAGRPDTITAEKLAVLKRCGVGRISINPQSMKDETLKIIGRAHTADDTLRAFSLARDAGFSWINADLIAGLPGETLDDFNHSLAQMIALGAENITLHTLAVKRASRLKELDSAFHYKDEAMRDDMLADAHRTLRKHGYRPYYLYRQKHTSGNTENIGFCKDDALSVYNIRIMEEAQSILALGAGGISKVYFPAENRLERVANVSNYEIYIERIEEMIQRKADNLWRERIC